MLCGTVLDKLGLNVDPFEGGGLKPFLLWFDI